MNGHEPLLAMRRDRRVPRCVWITDGEDIRSRDWHEEVNYADQQRHAVIEISASDIPEALDFRCVIGLEVHLSAERGQERARRLHGALVEAEARRVITTIHNNGQQETVFHGF
jgi:hypothetical protein